MDTVAMARECHPHRSASIAACTFSCGARNWLPPPLNNARLASLGLYEGRVGAFKATLRECSGQLACFYAETRALAELELDERKQRLDQMAD
jgi:predicted aminopeptidase